ncbi:membrane protein insertase YidC [Butyrivibrio sp. AE2032]|uniref:membrane protein insertase YidC n=1 Tax=Butyrivibrio sp. AE2032 TaxID=1458463 RepID=UPI000557FCF8|nr:membrane protein insertase YidC [Butyrivibrio sp. AE2032]
MILSMLYTFIISPLELLFEVIFMVADKIIGNAGLSIIFLSLAVNFLVLPLYKRADELQAEERDIQAKMAPRIKQIKSVFKGDERFLMMQEYYRVNHYKPVYALKSSVSLLLQIPFFIAAYNLLSGMQSLQGMQFGFISDLGKEDAMFTIGSFPVNVLPILMTLINIISGIIYTKGHPLKAKIQVYGLAAVFLVLLYRSPSGLVFYWLLNNVFSLVKNIFYKLKNPRKVLNIVLAAAGGIILVLSLIRTDLDARQKILLSAGCVLLALPLVSGLIRKKTKPVSKAEPAKADRVFFFGGAILMAFITGLLIPAGIVDASPAEFIDVMHPYNPAFYIINSMLLSFGSWVLWGGVFYFFMSDKIKVLFCKAIWIICGVSLADHLLFGRKLGNLSSTLQYDLSPSFELTEHLLNLLAIAAVSVIFYFAYIKFHKIAKNVLVVGILSVMAIGAYNSADVWRTYLWYQSSSAPSSEMPEIPLSKNGKNVIVLMLDRAMGTETPYIFNEKPELLEQFDGFTYYPNTVSYGPYTNFGAPVLYGGYDYTPENMNARDSESLESKHNEALKVMPVIFGGNGYNVTVCDPTYAGYKSIPDLSIYDDCNIPSLHCYNTMGRFNYFESDGNSEASAELSARVNAIRNRNLFFFSLMRISPVILQETVYDGGMYNESNTNGSTEDMNVSVVQHMDGLSKSTGYRKFFLESYAVLTNLPNITKISNGNENNFLMMSNDTTHSPCLLQEPDYVPAMNVDNTAYDVDMVSRYTVDGVTMQMTTEDQIIHYQANMAAYIELGKWFDYLRENGVYDNTRIILVADHGRDLGQFGITCGDQDMEYFMPLLMVKDFNATGFTVSEEFMTNGDTPALATEGLIDDPVNPFTNNPINSDAKNGPQNIFFSNEIDVDVNNGNTFLPGKWYVLEGDPHDPASWREQL